MASDNITALNENKNFLTPCLFLIPGRHSVSLKIYFKIEEGNRKQTNLEASLDNLASPRKGLDLAYQILQELKSVYDKLQDKSNQNAAAYIS